MKTKRSLLALLVVASVLVAVTAAVLVVVNARSDTDSADDAAEDSAADSAEGSATDSAAGPDTTPDDATNESDTSVEDRKLAIIRRAARQPWPDPNSSDPGAAATGQVAHAYASYLVGDVETGNRRVDDLYESEFPHPGGPVDRWPGRLTSTVFMRMYVIDTDTRDRIGETQQGRIRQMISKYVDLACDLEDANSDPWVGEGSEGVRKSNCLLGTYALSHESYPAWREHLEGWLQERAKNGLFDEVNSPVYEKYNLASIYNLADFPGDEDIRRLAKQYLDLLWHDAAHDYNAETAVQGASGSRAYQPDLNGEGATDFSVFDPPWTGPWHYMYGWHDEGPPSGSPQPIILNAAASTYVPLSISRDLATMDGKQFEYASRRPGRSRATSGDSHHIRRDVTVTDDYILGAITYDPEIQRTTHATENIWYSVAMNHEPTDRIVVTGIAEPKGQSGNFADYFAINGVANEDVILAARDHDAENSRGIRVYLGKGDVRRNFETDPSGWMFTHAGDAYAAIRVPEPSPELPKGEDGNVASILLNDGEDIWAPIVIQMGQASNFDGFEGFKDAVNDLPYRYADGAVMFTSLAGHTYEMSRQQGRATLPTIDGREPNTDPLFSYESPFLSMDWKSLEATLSGPDGESVTLDFSS